MAEVFLLGAGVVDAVPADDQLLEGLAVAAGLVQVRGGRVEGLEEHQRLVLAGPGQSSGVAVGGDAQFVFEAEHLDASLAVLDSDGAFDGVALVVLDPHISRNCHFNVLLFSSF